MRHQQILYTLSMLAVVIKAELIDFTPCPSNTFGLVDSVDISPCERGASDEPCRFRFGSDYTITSELTVAYRDIV